MQTNQAKQFFRQADELVNIAQAELNRAKEDVVPHQICANTRNAIALYLKAFLTRHGTPLPDTTDLDLLVSTCQKSNPKFEELNLSTIDCRAHFDGHAYCSNINKVQECFELAQKTRAMTIDEKWPISVHTK